MSIVREYPEVCVALSSVLTWSTEIPARLDRNRLHSWQINTWKRRMSTLDSTLKPWNTFQLEARAAEVNVISSPQELLHYWQESRRLSQPLLLLGEGSNVLFLEDFAGRVLVNRIKGIDIADDALAWHLHIGAGENWHQLVVHLLSSGIPGLENLAMIPGCVGSAPIQNIGAYGVELSQVCEYVDVLSFSSGKTERISAADCLFGYRDSIFKHQYQTGYAIVAVGLLLPKNWVPVLTYGDLVYLESTTVQPQQIFDEVCRMRSSKLPDPKKTGNAGSFFKNPVVTAEIAQAIKSHYPQAPAYSLEDGKFKLAAGWLIDRCDLKGYRVGGAAVHSQQALVLINENNASANDVVALAREVRQRVGQKFNVWLEPEVRFIAADGEKDAVGVIS